MKRITLRRRPLLAGLAALPLAAPAVVRAQAKIVIPLATWGSPTHINIVQFWGRSRRRCSARATGASR